MSKGKYSPSLTRNMIAARKEDTFVFNALGTRAPDFTPGGTYDEKVHFGNYDENGFDSYGYSAWNADGTYAGIGEGIDSLGYREDDYAAMSDEDFQDIA